MEKSENNQECIRSKYDKLVEAVSTLGKEIVPVNRLFVGNMLEETKLIERMSLKNVSFHAKNTCVRVCCCC